MVPDGVAPAPVTLAVKLTDWPKTDGFGEELTAVVAAILFTLWFCVPELPMQFVSPEYVAVSDFGLPAVVEVRLQLPAPTAAEQISVPSLTVTVPVGAPLPGATGATVHETVYACPTLVAGLRPGAVMVVVVLA